MRTGIQRRWHRLLREFTQVGSISAALLSPVFARFPNSGWKSSLLHKQCKQFLEKAQRRKVQSILFLQTLATNLKFQEIKAKDIRSSILLTNFLPKGLGTEDVGHWPGTGLETSSLSSTLPLKIHNYKEPWCPCILFNFPAGISSLLPQSIISLTFLFFSFLFFVNYIPLQKWIVIYPYTGFPPPPNKLTLIPIQVSPTPQLS